MSQDHIYEELLNSGPFAVIELFELRLFKSTHGVDEEYYFHAGRNRKTTEPTSSDDLRTAFSIKYGGQVYVPLPIEASGFEFKGDGGLPRPTIRIANLNSNISQVLLSVNLITPGNDLNGAQVTRVRTLSRFLDASNWENGINPYGTPVYNDSAQMPKEVYYIDRKVAENRDFVEFEMVSSLDLANARAPRRLVMQNLCQWKYKGKECGYGGEADYTPVGTQIVKTAATSYPYSSGRDVLASGSTLLDGESLISPNGWFTAVMQNNGEFVLYTKPEPTFDYYNDFVTTSVNKIGNYYLEMQTDGNLVLYDRELPRGLEAVLWASNTVAYGEITSLTRYSDGTKSVWYPPDNQNGRSGAYSYELVGRIPTQAEADAGTEVTAPDRTFSGIDPELGARSMTLRFTFRAINFDPGHFTGLTRGFNFIVSVVVVSQTGNWRNGEHTIPPITVGEIVGAGNNPFGAASNPDGALEGKQVGPVYVINTATTTKQLRLKNDGRLVIENPDGSGVTWMSPNASITTEPQVTTTTIPGQQVPPKVSGQCGKTLDDCKLRFGSGALPFGSFPSVGGNT